LVKDEFVKTNHGKKQLEDCWEELLRLFPDLKVFKITDSTYIFCTAGGYKKARLAMIKRRIQLKKDLAKMEKQIQSM